METRPSRASIQTLHVDDDEMFGTVTAELLESVESRLDVVSVTSAAAGLDRLADGDVDCVVSDYDMPGGNGIEFLERVRERYPRLPFILFTGKGSEEVASDAVSVGVTDYLQKESGIDQYTVLANRIVNATEKYWTETALEQRITQQEALAALGRSALASDELASLFDEAVRLVVDGLDCEYAGVLEWQPSRDELDFRAGVGWDDIPSGASIPAGGESQAGYTLANGESVVVTDLDEETRFDGPGPLADYGVVSGVSVVIGATAAPWGVLGVHTTDRRDFTAQDVTFVQNVANVLATAIDRHQTEERLRESESRFREIAELSPDGIFRTDTDGEFTYVSPASETLLGRSADDLLGTPFERVVAERSLDAARRGIDRVLDGEVVRGLALTLVDADGESFDVEVSASPVRHDDTVDFVQGFARDVTESKERERELQHSRERYQALVDAFPNGGVFLFDEDLRYTMAGGDRLEGGGLTPEMMLGKTPSEVFPPENAELLEESYRAALAGERHAFEDEYQGRHFHVQTIPLRNEAGEVISGMAVAQDITERVGREHELEESRERYQTLVDNFPGGVFRFDRELRLGAIGGLEIERAGMDPAELEGQLIEDVLTPEGFEPLEPHYRATLDGESRSFEYEWNGAYYHVQTLPLRDADGTVVAGMAVSRNVTERVERERELEESRARYRTLVDNFPGGVVLYDRDLRVVAGGGTEFERADWDPIAAAGEPLRDNITPEGAEYLDTHYQAALDGEARTFQYEASGTHYQLQTIPVRDADGRVTEGIAVTQNVTERVERERKLAQLRERSWELMYTETRRETARAAVNAAREVVGASLSGFHEVSADGDRLEPGIMAKSVDDVFETSPEFGRDAEPGTRAAITWEVFESGESRYIFDISADESVAEPSPAGCVLLHPIGRHGVFVVSSPETDAYDETDRMLVDILAASLTAAMDRVEREQRLRAREQRLEAQNERLSRFASIVSHDLRSPLSVAQGRLVLARAHDEDRDENLDAVEAAHDRMDRLIEGLLQLTVDGEGIETDRLGLSTAARAAWQSVETTRATLVVETTRDVTADENRLRQLFENLFRNSVEHGSTDNRLQAGDSVEHGSTASRSQAHGNSVEHGSTGPGGDTEDATVTVTVGDLDDGFFVEDDGPGIEPDRHEEVFEAGHSTTAGGSGLGLRIVADVVDEHGWSVTVTDGTDGGARFEFTGTDVGSQDDPETGREEP